MTFSYEWCVEEFEPYDDDPDDGDIIDVTHWDTLAEARRHAETPAPGRKARIALKAYADVPDDWGYYTAWAYFHGSGVEPGDVLSEAFEFSTGGRMPRAVPKRFIREAEGG